MGGTELAFTRVLKELATRPEMVVRVAYPEGGEFDTAWSEMAEHFSYRAGSLPVSWSFPGYLLWLFRRLRYGADFRRQSASFNPDVIVSFTSVLTAPVEIGHHLRVGRPGNGTDAVGQIGNLTGEGLTKTRWFSYQRIIGDTEVMGESATVEVTFVDKENSRGYLTKFGLHVVNGKWKIYSFKTFQDPSAE